MSKELSLKKFGRSILQLLCFFVLFVNFGGIFMTLTGDIELNIFKWILAWFVVLFWSYLYAEQFLLKNND